jgi:hypothetical protein
VAPLVSFRLNALRVLLAFQSCSPSEPHQQWELLSVDT